MKPIVAIIMSVGVGALAFYGGMQYQKSQSTSSRNFTMGGQQQGSSRTGVGVARRMGNGQPVSGEIISIDSTSLTVKLPDGSSRIVLFTDKTIFNKTAAVEKTEVKVGEKVGVFGTSNTDGSMTAQNIQLNPQFRMGGAGTASGSAR